jgi:hypothetical protein
MRHAVGQIRALVMLLVALFVGCGSCGCVTADMWDRATQTKLSPSQIRGFITSPRDRHTPVAIVVCYSPINHSSSIFDPVLAVPWRPDPDNLGIDYLTTPTEEDFARSRQEWNSADFQEDDPRHPGVRWAVGQITFTGVGLCHIDAYPMQGHPPRWSAIEQKIELVVPDNVPRPAQDLRAARLDAVLLIPASLVADVVQAIAAPWIFSLEGG